MHLFQASTCFSPCCFPLPLRLLLSPCLLLICTHAILSRTLSRDLRAVFRVEGGKANKNNQTAISWDYSAKNTHQHVQPLSSWPATGIVSAASEHPYVTAHKGLQDSQKLSRRFPRQIQSKDSPSTQFRFQDIRRPRAGSSWTYAYW